MNELRAVLIGHRGMPLAITVSLLLGAAELAGSNASKDSPQKKAIQQILADQVTAWNRGDLDGFMAGYWKSDALSFFSGKDQTNGWKATLERYQKRYQAEGKEMGKLTFRELRIELLSTDSAFVRGRWQLEMKKQKPGGLFTLIMKKLPEGWRIVHDHTSS